MGSKNLQNMRDVLEKGMRVFVKVRHTDGVTPKLKPARVLAVLRGAAKVAFEGDTKGRVIRFSMIELDHEALSQREQRKVVGDDALPEAPLPAPLPPPPPAGAALAAVAATERSLDREVVVSDDLQTWITMGREMLDPIKQRCADITEELRILSEEHSLITEEIATKNSELGELNAKQRVINGTLREMEKAS